MENTNSTWRSSSCTCQIQMDQRLTVPRSCSMTHWIWSRLQHSTALIIPTNLGTTGPHQPSFHRVPPPLAHSYLVTAVKGIWAQDDPVLTVEMAHPALMAGLQVEMADHQDLVVLQDQAALEVDPRMDVTATIVGVIALMVERM